MLIQKNIFCKGQNWIDYHQRKVDIGAKVKIASPELSDYNKTGIVQDAAPGGKFYMVKLKTGLAYFHESDLRVDRKSVV